MERIFDRCTQLLSDDEQLDEELDSGACVI